jgi:hypothetical protein
MRKFRPILFLLVFVPAGAASAKEARRLATARDGAVRLRWTQPGGCRGLTTSISLMRWKSASAV